LANTSLLLSSISDLLGKSMGGSVVSAGIMFAAAGNNKAGTVSRPCRRSVRMKEIGGAKTGDRTMIDALEPAAALPVENHWQAAAVP
jgi:dihydroxyacetone kinase